MLSCDPRIKYYILGCYIHVYFQMGERKPFNRSASTAGFSKEEVTQGTNARKVSEVYAFLYCSLLSLGGKVNTRRMSQPDMESIFTKIIYEIFWS